LRRPETRWRHRVAAASRGRFRPRPSGRAVRVSHVRIIAAATLLAAMTGCVAPDEPAPVVRRSALGEPNNGFPSAAERLGIMAINRARSDPATVRGAQSAAYPARPPVLWSYELSRSARFHATSLQLANVTL